jgi:tRNA threonylcarbamoyl adenosine modification protein (Sua5/YciO/YrdC/YwlC family)
LSTDDLEPVLAVLRAGHVLGVPTDTVYGLAARLEPGAIDRVFAAKGRPVDLALPVLLGAKEQVDRVAASLADAAAVLADRFWPGPLTIIVRARRALGQLVGGDGRTVGIRWPNHPLVEQICLAMGPLAVTSANRHGDPPCTSAARVRAAFGGQLVAAVVDGGECAGAPSTVVDCTKRRPTCVREGALSWTEITRALD